MQHDDAPVVVTGACGQAIETVWRALTEPDSMRRWSFEARADFRPEPGFETVFTVSCGGRAFPHR